MRSCSRATAAAVCLRRCRLEKGRRRKVERGKIGMDTVGCRFRGDQEIGVFAGWSCRRGVVASWPARARAGKIMERMGFVLARQRPQPRADADALTKTDDPIGHRVAGVELMWSDYYTHLHLRVFPRLEIARMQSSMNA